MWAAFKSPTNRRKGQTRGSTLAGRRPRGLRGAGWQRGQKNDERLVKAIRRIGVAHRSQGSPSRP